MNGGGSVIRFSESAPRPPVFPGEENVPSSQVKMDPWASRFGRRGPSHPSTLSPSKGSSPVLTPRRHGQSMDEYDLARRYEPAEGSASTSPPLVETPPYLRWAENLHFLLTDPDGVELFEKYLEQENCSHLLKFWFACEGLKRNWAEDPEKAVQIIQVIYKKYIRLKRVNVSELNRREINDRVANKATLDAHIFDEAQKDVEDLIRSSVYVNFLNSDVYLSYIQSMQNGIPDSPRSGRSQGGGSDITAKSSVAPDLAGTGASDDRGPHLGPLPTLHEDSEFSYPAVELNKPIPLTHDALMATKNVRMNVESRPVGGLYPSSRVPHNPYHSVHTTSYYAPYNPVSRQDSEISSDAHTDDTRSLTDGSVDGSVLFYPAKPNRHQLRKARQKISNDCMRNRDPSINQPFIPRTQRPPPKEQGMPKTPQEFAAELIQKLEAVKRDRESEEKLLRIVAERDSEASGLDEPCPQGARFKPGSECSARVLAEALSKIASSNEADTQSILDNHVQRIWADQTPLRSPGAPSPRPWSPENRRRLPPNSVAIPTKTSGAPIMSSSAYGPGYFQRSSAHHRRKDKDIEKGSTYSADSGAILDQGDSGRENRAHFSKSQSIPDTRRIGMTSSLGGASSAIGSKKSEYDRVHDSGLCLHTDPNPGTLMAPPSQPPKEKVLHWISTNDKWQEADRDPSSSKHRSRPPSSTSPISSRRSRQHKSAYGTSRSESLERAGASAGHLTQSEDDMARNRPPTKPKPSVSQPTSTHSTTMKKPASSGALSGEGSSAPTECTVVTFTFGDEPVPYRSRIPGRTVTLKQFKEICVPKKGNYKYYFKTNCEDDVAMAVNQEVIDDSEILPLWEDKVLGIVKLVD
ncbi:axin-like isoform X2 [Daphnia pulicaria]|uniref:axin-like isoform X2 n=1 Tax=Daphnia pulicaria TaxID=35523 RepID=UPI001EEA0DA1|nr:axin-like isoform X2 [Daphnia pulicaria]